MNKAIGILGCGWLGLPLAESLVKKGYKVFGTTTSEQKLHKLQKAGIVPFLIRLSENSIDGSISNLLGKVDVLVINVPPKLRDPSQESYIKKIELVYKALAQSKVSKILFVSSTSVYGDTEGVVTEETKPVPTTLSGKQLLASERLFIDSPFIECTIIRFGGLIGEERHPINMLSGKKGLKNGNHPVNLIHLQDCIRLISAVIKKHWWGEIFNAVYPLHPSKRTYYQKIAVAKGKILPQYAQDSEKTGKEIDSSKLIHVKKFDFMTSILE